MMSNNSAIHSESFYERIDYIIPVSVFSVMIMIGLIFYISLCLYKKDLSFKMAYAVSKIVFSSLEVSANKDKDGKSTYSLLGNPISTYTLAHSFMVTVQILALAVVVALEVLLLEESNICDSGFDCFDIANGTYIEDCNDFVGRKARCYRLVYRIDLAVGAFGGVLTFVSKSITLYENIMLPIQKIFRNQCGTIGVYTFFIITDVIITAIYVVGIVVLLDIAGQLKKAEWKAAVVYLITLLLTILGTSVIVLNSAKQMIPKDSVAHEESNLINIQHSANKPL